MGSPSITWLIIGTAAFIAVIVLMTNSYIDITSQNNGTIDNAYLAKYAALQGYQTYLSGQANTMSTNQSLWWSIPNIFASTFNVLAIGVGALQQLFSILNWLPNIFQLVFQTSIFPPIVWWFVQVALLIGIPTTIYMAIRNAGRLP
jgi:hypothetical protein